MLDTVDLSSKMEKDAYKPLMADLSDRLYYVQQASWAAGVPVIILFEGWDAAGKGTTIHKLTDPIDPRGYKIYPIRAVRTYEKKHPWLWRFWLKIPARGEWAIFDRSWYGRVLVERMENLVEEKDWKRAYRDIVDFERTLADDGTLIIKFFLHISKKEQQKRFDKLTDDPLNAWRVSDEDLRNHKRYKKWLRIYQEMLEQTDTEWGPWTIVEATDRRHTQVKVYQTIIRALESRLGISAESMLMAGEKADTVDVPAKKEESPDSAALQVETTPEQ
jgi:AMP-polyphosphate phosphotransferase